MLPTQKTSPKQSLSDLTVLVYGPNKFGKSGLCAKAEGALFLATEPGLNHLEVYQQPISSWDELLIAARELAEGKHPFRTVVLDTIDNAYRMCAEHVCQRNKIEHESDLEYGKGYALVNGEFYRVLNKLALLPYGLFLISHAQEKEIETRKGKYTKVIPTLPEKARKQVLGLVDLILFCDFELVPGPDGKTVQRRVLRTKPSATYEAGDRTGRLPDVLDFDFAAFARAFASAASPTASLDRAGKLPQQSDRSAAGATSATAAGGPPSSADGTVPGDLPAVGVPPRDRGVEVSTVHGGAPGAPASGPMTTREAPGGPAPRSSPTATKPSTPAAARPRTSSAPSR